MAPVGKRMPVVADARGAARPGQVRRPKRVQGVLYDARDLVFQERAIVEIDVSDAELPSRNLGTHGRAVRMRRVQANILSAEAGIRHRHSRLDLGRHRRIKRANVDGNQNNRLSTSVPQSEGTRAQRLIDRGARLRAIAIAPKPNASRREKRRGRRRVSERDAGLIGRHLILPQPQHQCDGGFSGERRITTPTGCDPDLAQLRKGSLGLHNHAAVYENRFGSFFLKVKDLYPAHARTRKSFGPNSPDGRQYEGKSALTSGF